MTHPRCTAFLIPILLIAGFTPSTLAVGSDAQALNYTAIPITGSARLHDVSPIAINDAGQVVGQADRQAFVWQNGRMIVFPRLPDVSWGDGGNDAEANAISENGKIVGGSGGFAPFVMSGLYSCYVFSGDTSGIKPLFTNLDPKPPEQNDNGKVIPHEESFEAFGVNNSGTIIGIDAYRGFYYSHEREVIVQPISHYDEGNGSRCTAINNRGWFVGATTINKQFQEPGGASPQLVQGKWKNVETYYTVTGIHAFLCRGSYPAHRLIDLGTLPGFPYSSATAINSYGDVVGYTGTSGGDKWARVNGGGFAFLWKAGKMTALKPLPGDKNCMALGVNDQDIVVGLSGENHACLWISGQVHDLGKLVTGPKDMQLLSAVGINNKGQIICKGAGKYDPNNLSGEPTGSGWLLTPIPDGTASSQAQSAR